MTTKTTPNWQPLDLTNKCGSCQHYEPRYKGELLTAHGTCKIRNNRYKQRNETCKKYMKFEGENQYASKE